MTNDGPQTTSAAILATGTQGPIYAPKDIQQMAQQLCGFERQSLSASVYGTAAGLNVNANPQCSGSHGKTSVTDAVGYSLPPTDLMGVADSDNMQKTRAVGAVG